MDASTQERLNALNREFYSRHAADFDATRRNPWPGWERALSGLGDAESAAILDVGCGNARLGHYLASLSGVSCAYTGVDVSHELLVLARERAPAGWRLIALDVVDDGLDALDREFDFVTCFGVMHHLPGEATRRALMEEMAARLAPGGRLAVSFWQFAHRRRFERRALGAEVSGMAALLEPGDYLLPWGEVGEDSATGSSMRYCHHADDAEVDRLVDGLGLEIADGFRSDGHSGDLNLYRILRRG